MSDTVKIPLRRHDGSLRAHALIDAADMARVGMYRWHFAEGYAKHSWKEGDRVKHFSLHRFVLNLKPGDGHVVDHINGDGLDNRRCNLRVVSGRENHQNVIGLHPDNRSGYRGVQWDASTGVWRARVRYEGRLYSLGRFRDVHGAGRNAQRFYAKHVPFSPEAASLSVVGVCSDTCRLCTPEYGREER